MIVVPCDLEKVEFSRTHWPFLRDRRMDAYGNLTKRFVDATLSKRLEPRSDTEVDEASSESIERFASACLRDFVA